MAQNGISVVVCCYNSVKRIKTTLECLSLQINISIDQWEIILINNASTDNTIIFVEEVWENINLPKPVLKIFNELKPGLSAARNRGIQESLFKYILFCDDDNWLSQDYLSSALKLMYDNPKIGVLGGIGDPVFETEQPPYFWINQYHTLAVGPQYSQSGDITETRGVVYGAGMVLNKFAYYELLNKFDFEFLTTDRKGDSLVSGGDHELCIAIKKIGYKVFWSEELKFKHYMPKNRTTINYYKKLFIGNGLSQPFLDAYSINTHNIGLKADYRYSIFRCLKNIIFSYFKLFFKGYFFSKNEYKFIDILQTLCINYGMLLTMSRIKNSLYKNLPKIIEKSIPAS